MKLFRCTAVYTMNSFFVRCVLLAIFVGAQLVEIFFFLMPLFKDGRKSSLITFYILAALWGFPSLLWIWSYIVTSWMDAGSVENELYKNGYIDKQGHLSSNLPPEISQIPRCEKCHLPKPYRTHHCSQCDKCYFRFDHHCDVVGNCIAYNNMKSFMLFLFYSSFLLFFLAITSIVSYVVSKKVDLSYVITACLLGLLLGIGVCFFGILYIPEVCMNNRTTLERIAGNDPKTFDAGLQNNIKQIFGGCPLLWIFPTRPSIDGFTWSSLSSNVQFVHKPSPENDKMMMSPLNNNDDAGVNTEKNDSIKTPLIPNRFLINVN